MGSRCLLVIRVSGCSRDPVPPARMTPFIRGSLDRAATWCPGPLLQHGIGQLRPGPDRPRAEGPIAQPRADHPRHRIHPQEGATAAEVPVGRRGVGGAGPVWLLASPDLHAQTPVTRLEAL